MEGLKCIAVDWSGAQDEQGQLAHIWLAVAEAGSLNRLTNGFTRDEVVAVLVEEIKSDEPVIIGLDFAFSFPQWYLQWRNKQNARGLWKLAEAEGDQWLNGDTWPFWGRRDTTYQKRPADLTEDLRLRATEEDHNTAKSVFQINGKGSVGTGTIRGLPALKRLQDAGATIWPFDAVNPNGSNVVEIYPRAFYGRGVINNRAVRGRNCRRVYLEKLYPCLERYWRDIMTGSDDAFDAGVSALVMSANAANIQALQQPAQLQRLREGEIWTPV